ncbi:hypothetical protein GGU11DRAFT_866501 [Lentinula aff. detonsa]|nr:hypothetical protein GGU11DRAFT_866501 [Lentinula aff. detonsa]
MCITNPSSSTEFDGITEGDQIAIILEVDYSQLNPDRSNLHDTISLALVSKILGPSPSVDLLHLAFIHAHAFFSYDTTTYKSFLNCAAFSSKSKQQQSTNRKNNCQTTFTTPTAAKVSETTFAASKKRYKPVHRRVQPVQTTLPEKFHVVRSFPTDPLANLPLLNPNPPEFTPTGRYTQEQKEFIDAAHDMAFLWPEEMKAIHHLMMVHERAFAWTEDKKGQFNPKYFPPVEFPVIKHIPC